MEARMRRRTGGRGWNNGWDGPPRLSPGRVRRDSRSSIALAGGEERRGQPGLGTSRQVALHCRLASATHPARILLQVSQNPILVPIIRCQGMRVTGKLRLLQFQSIGQVLEQGSQKQRPLWMREGSTPFNRLKRLHPVIGLAV